MAKEQPEGDINCHQAQLDVSQLLSELPVVYIGKMLIFSVDGVRLKSLIYANRNSLLAGGR